MSTTVKERGEMIDRLARLGIGYDDAQRFRRIAMTLHRWHEQECGSETGCIERNETTGKPYWYNPNRPLSRRSFLPIADREKGALKRLASLMGKYPHLVEYVQTDPRGASLYLLRRTQLEAGQNIDSYYSQGTAIY